MGVTRAFVSHPFEILKVQSQLNLKKQINLSLYRGVSYSLISNGMERGIQFFLFNKFLKNNESRLNSAIKSSIVSTSISLPYNILLLKRIINKNEIKINKKNFLRAGGLEYTRNLSGSTIFLFIYDLTKSHTRDNIFISTIIASAVVWGVTFPIDTIKNNIINSGNFTFKKLYKGIQYPLLRTIPSSLIGMFVYEKVLKLIND
jgi:hypothetical protein